VLCRIITQIFINLPNDFAKWRGHYENDEYKLRLQSTSLWSQLEIARTLWMDKCKELGLPERKSLQDILTWCEDKNNQVIDTTNQTRRQRWSETDNASWRKHVVANLAPSVSQSNRQFIMTIVQKSAFVWTTLVSFVKAVDK
jgi:hypothetical protein